MTFVYLTLNRWIHSSHPSSLETIKSCYSCYTGYSKLGFLNISSESKTPGDGGDTEVTFSSFTSKWQISRTIFNFVHKKVNPRFFFFFFDSCQILRWCYLCDFFFLSFYSPGKNTLIHNFAVYQWSYIPLYWLTDVHAHLRGE